MTTGGCATPAGEDANRTYQRVPLTSSYRVAIQHGSEAREGSLNVLGLRTLENRTYPLPGRPVIYPRVHVTPPQTGVEGLDARRLAEWMPTRRPIVTPPPTTVDQDGTVEGPPPVETDPDLLAARMQNWLGDGQGPR